MPLSVSALCRLTHESRDDRASVRPAGRRHKKPHLALSLHRRIRDSLVADTDSSRGLFGRLQGAAKEWDAIVRLYEKESLFVPEAAQTLAQGTDYDFPAFRKAAQRIQGQLSVRTRAAPQMLVESAKDKQLAECTRVRSHICTHAHREVITGRATPRLCMISSLQLFPLGL